MTELGSVIRAKKSERIPVVFSRNEVSRVIGNLYGQKKLIAKLLYGTGMRLNEARMAMALPPEKPLEKFRNRPRRPLAPGRKPDATGCQTGNFRGRN